MIPGHRCRCPTATFAQLAAITMLLADDPDWTYRRPLVQQDRPSAAAWRWGCAIGRVVRYPAGGAPVCVVAHELAHLAAGARAGHGPVWARQAVTIGGRLAHLLATGFQADQPPAEPPGQA